MLGAAACAALFVVLPIGCSTGKIASPDGSMMIDAGPPPPPDYDANVDHFCELPGSVRFDGKTKTVVPGASGLPDLTWIDLPAGFCVHYFATVPNARSIRFAPGGELFATSPSRGTTGGGPGGRSAVLVLPDDNKDGLADSTNPFVGGISAVQGILFANGYFYYQNDAQILKVPYTPGERQLTKAPTVVADLSTRYQSGVHWPKTLDIADDGTIYVANGSDQDEQCESPNRPFRGGIFAIDGKNPIDGKPIAKGFRNPIFVRCQRGHNLCFASELTLDYSWMQGGREKIVPIREGDDWGYPCCATKNVPFTGLVPLPDCSGTADETVSFYVADTPFGFDFEPGRWAMPWSKRMFVALHGQFGTWIGARILTIDIDAATGMPIPGGTYADGGQMNTGSARDFATGWDDRKLDHGRPSDVTFAADGRMFVAQDVGPDWAGSIGIILWFAPLDLPKPK